MSTIPCSHSRAQQAQQMQKIQSHYPEVRIISLPSLFSYHNYSWLDLLLLNILILSCPYSHGISILIVLAFLISEEWKILHARQITPKHCTPLWITSGSSKWHHFSVLSLSGRWIQARTEQAIAYHSETCLIPSGYVPENKESLW